MRGPAALLTGLLLTLAAGCRNCDLVEAELRTRQRELLDLHAEFLRVEAENHALHRELRGLRTANPSLTPTVEEASQTTPVRQIVLNRQTGGYDDDGCPGDEALMVAVEPRDADGHALKAPGMLYVEAVEINRAGLKSVLSTWELSEAELRRTWRSSLLSNGYHVKLPWKNWPTADRLRVVARLTLPDGRAFEADREVRVRPTAGRQSASALVVPRDMQPPKAADLWREGLERTALWSGPRTEAVTLGRPVADRGNAGKP